MSTCIPTENENIDAFNFFSQKKDELSKLLDLIENDFPKIGFSLEHDSSSFDFFGLR